MQTARGSLRRCWNHWDVLHKCSCFKTIRPLSANAMPIPAPDDAPKTYSPKIEKIVVEIASLTLLEVSELTELMKKRLNLPDAPVFPAGGFMPVASNAAPADDEEDKKQEAVKNVFNVKLMKFDETKKVALIKGLKAIMPDMNLVQAKKFVESAPVLVKENVDKEEAEKLKNELSALGAEITVD